MKQRPPHHITRTKNVYLDVCTLCRPYDDQSYLRIRMETTATQLIFSEVDEKRYVLRFSPVHIKEISAIADQIERMELLHFLKATGKLIPPSGQRERGRAEELVCLGLGPADAAHISFAEIEHCDFVTCDDRLCRKCGKLDLKIWIGNPVVFCEKEGLK